MKENKRVNMRVIELPEIFSEIERQRVSIIKHAYQQLSGLEVADDGGDSDGSKGDILIGLNMY